MLVRIIIVLYCIYTFIQRFLQCTPIRSASCARDPCREKRAVNALACACAHDSQ